MSYKEHHRLVNEFLDAAREEDPERYETVSKQTPLLTFDQWRRVHGKEQPVGLIGLEPVKIPQQVAFDNNLDTEFDGE